MFATSMAKSSKRSSASTNSHNNTSKSKKKKKSNKSGPEAVAMKVKAPNASNPFESIWSRRKFDVLGQKQRKGESRRIGLARSLAVEKARTAWLRIVPTFFFLCYFGCFWLVRWWICWCWVFAEEEDAPEGVRTEREVFGVRG